ncbi:penicillin-binding protein 1C [Marivirga tractuosa]|uniref:penicillin-binding protein 1C n=1 Tax=Marivirga tractuosa TaxID=1006 RepID=UPI0035D08B24
MRNILTTISSHKIKFSFGILIIALLVFLSWPISTPVFDKSYSTVLFDKKDELLGVKLAEDEIWRFPVTDSIPKRFETALLTYEDAYFYQHPGINPVAIFKALIENIQQGRVVRGGSTLSMQLARMADGNQARTIPQKIKEIGMALRYEWHLSKEEILNLYVSHAPFGSNIEGLSAASWRYFERESSELSWGEAATLAVLPNQPSMIYPGRNTQSLERKRNQLLAKLMQEGYFDSTTFRLAKSEKIPQGQYIFPKETQHLLHELQTKNAGKIMKSTLDRHLQERISEMADAYSQNLKTNEIHNAAVLVMDWRTEEVVAYVGNVATGDDHQQDVDIIQARRSPGSLLKPFLYAHAVDKGIISPQQMLPDIPLFYEGFSPKNFDHNYYGAVKADQALARSLNIPFVTLLKDYGYEAFYHELKKMGFYSMNQPPLHYGLSMILGGADISLWEIASMYVKLARSINSHQKSKAEISLLKSDKSEKAKHPVSAGAAWLTLKAMKDLARPGEETGWEQFGSAQNIAWKTGTSFGFRDAWAVGINQQYTVAVWTGNADGEGRPGLIGARTAAPLLFQILKLLNGGDEDFQMPVREMKTRDFCVETGYLAGENCNRQSKYYVNMPPKMLEICPFHQQIFVTNDGEKRVNSNCYPVSKMKSENYLLLPPAQARYYKKYNADFKEAPEWLSACLQNRENPIQMVYPRHSTSILIPMELEGKIGSAVFEAAHQNSEATVFWYLDDQYLGKTKGTHQMEINSNREGKHKLYLADSEGEYLSFTFEVVANGAS